MKARGQSDEFGQGTDGTMASGALALQFGGGAGSGWRKGACARGIFNYCFDATIAKGGEARMEEITCPNCNVDVDREELKRNNLRCPTCGFDLSDAGEVEEPDEDSEADAIEDEDEDEEDEEDDEEED